MAEYAYPMDSKVTYNGNGVPTFDRAVTSAQLRGMIGQIITNGVLMANNSNALRVIANGDNTVTVQPGLCVINGAIKKFKEPTIMLRDAFDSSDNSAKGIAICAQFSLIDRDIRIVFYSYNAQSATDLIPLNKLMRDDSIYAIQLANIYIAPGSVRIVQSNITDTRLNTDRCGAVSSISQFDTTNLYNQIQSDLASFKSTEQAEFQEWFKNLQTVLDSNTAAHLQNEIDGLNSSKANKSDITDISITGTTNNTGSNILAGTLFYLNGSLCKTLVDVANGANFTLNTNYESTDVGNNFLNKLNNGQYEWFGFIVSTPGGGGYFNQSIPVMPDQTLTILSLQYLDDTWHVSNLETTYNYGNFKCPRCSRIDEHDVVVRYASVKFTLS